MGKSKRIRRSDEQMLREFQKRRRILKYVVIATTVPLAFALGAVWLGFLERIWILWAALAVYAAAFFALRMASHCPYCGKPIMRKFDKQTHCPYCRRAIRPGR